MSMTLSSGKMDRAVTLQTLTDSDGPSGYPVERWVPLSTEWMEKLDTTGGERFIAAQNAANLQVRWRMYWRDDMDPDSVDVQKTRRLFYLGRVYDITNAIELGRREGIELLTIASARADE